MSRRVLTKSTIDDAIAAGETQIRIGERDIVTSLARDYASDRGIFLVTENAPAAAVASLGQPQSGSSNSAAQVRRAVISALGYEPEGLDRIIAKLQSES